MDVHSQLKREIMHKNITRTIIFTIVFILALVIYKIAVAQDVIHCTDYQEIKDFAKCEVDKHWDDQWTYFDDLVMRESSWIHNKEHNSSLSTAFGLGGFLNSTWEATGYAKTDDMQIQILATIEYVKQRYKTPQEAINYHNKHNFY